MHIMVFILDGGMELLLKVLGKFGFGRVLWVMFLSHISSCVLYWGAVLAGGASGDDTVCEQVRGPRGQV